MMEECGSYQAELELFFFLFVCLRLQVQKSSHIGEIIAASLYIYVPWIVLVISIKMRDSEVSGVVVVKLSLHHWDGLR